MFELLLQADRALANGALDQAERTYWQLVDLDPTNAIAVAGLARVWLGRGDERSARTFADRALSIDPDSIAARRVLEEVTHEGPEHPAQEQPELPLLAAERLEALSRRRGKKAGAEGEGQDVAGKNGGSRGGTAGAAAAALPSEPLRERRQAGRLSAAAAAAAAAAREPVRPRHEPHHAMPVGRRLFESADLKPPLTDAFSAAEMAAAVEAVDAMDDNGGAGFDETPAAAPAGYRRAGSHSDLLNAVDATAADDSIALRVALVAGTADLEAAEQEAAAREASEDSFEAAEAMAGAANFLPVEPGWDQIQLKPTVGGESSEEEAEAEALREAIAIVLQGDGNVAEAEPSPSHAGPDEPVESAQPVESAGHSEAASPQEPAESSEPPESEAGPEQSTRKHGLFHRIRGS